MVSPRLANMALRNVVRCICKEGSFTTGFRRASTLTPQLVATQSSRQLLPQIMSSPPARSLLTQEYFQPLDVDVKDKDPTEVIKSLDPVMQKKLKVIQMEYEVLIQMGHWGLPEKMSDSQWLEMLQLTTVNSRKRFYRYLRKIELTRQAKDEKKLKRQQENQSADYDPAEKVTRNGIFMFIRQQTMNQYYYSRLCHAIQFGQPIIFDMNFENAMRDQDVMRLFEQFLMAYGSNKIHPDPFHIVLCNHDPDSHFQKIFENSCQKRDSDEFLFTVSDQNYLDLYPHKELVYLTPDAPNELTNFDHDAIYILGGLVDKVNARPLTLAKGKRERLKMAKLPLDRYLKWTMGNKSLTLNQMVDIMLEMKVSNDWNKALTHVPRRKLMEHKRRIPRQNQNY